MSTNVNATTNATQDSSCFDSTATRTRETTVLCALFVASLVGNICIGLVVCKTKTLRKPIIFFIVNMAMSDLLFPVFLLPRILTRLYVDTWLIKGPLGEAMCKIVSYSIEMSALVSIQSLVLVAVDRFVAVVYPLRSPLISSKLCCFFILATWIISLAIKSPDLFAWKLVENRNGLACRLRWKEAFGESLPFKSYMLALIVIFWYIPLVLIAILFITIENKFNSHETPGEQTLNVGIQRLKRERNVSKMSVAVVLVFTVCWLPATIRMLLSLYSSDNIMISFCSFQYFEQIAYFLAQSNCAINPYISFIFSGNYREGLKSLLSCLYRSNRLEPLPKLN
ncbi:octopamine receptor 1-like [Stylophora pistillata]|uniref:octopamine receptor 1-like n=1 Tax=Stylophora pistillata TaxID=50429 RepID=UPI000C04F525|nr:octopamine receptor 1-like [Stylophora pistillata]